MLFPQFSVNFQKSENTRHFGSPPSLHENLKPSQIREGSMDLPSYFLNLLNLLCIPFENI